MEYLKPIESLNQTISLLKKLILGLFGLLAILLIGMPTGAPLLLATEQGALILNKEGWTESTSRIEHFTKYYLSSRFEWSEETFKTKSESLKFATTPSIYSKLKNSLSAFELIAKNQKASSYYILEGFRFSHENHRIEARITRVLRIEKVALATPLRIEIEYQDVSLTKENPFGMAVSTLEELELE